MIKHIFRPAIWERIWKFTVQMQMQMQPMWFYTYQGKRLKESFENTTTPHCCEKPFQHIFVIHVVNTQFLTTFWEITLNSTVTQKPFQHIQIVICVVNTRFGILQWHSGEKPFQHIIIVIGVVNYMIPDKVLRNRFDIFFLTVIGVLKHDSWQRFGITLNSNGMSWDEWS